MINELMEKIRKGQILSSKEVFDLIYNYPSNDKEVIKVNKHYQTIYAIYLIKDSFYRITYRVGQNEEEPIFPQQVAVKVEPISKWRVVKKGVSHGK
jgi:hypothetical protein